MSTSARALAEQYIQEYKRTPEFGNWDHVIELGKRLADTVVDETKSEPRTAQPATKGVKPALSEYADWAKDTSLKKKITPSDDEIRLAKNGKFASAVKALCIREDCTISQARDVLAQYRTAAPF